MSAEIVLSAEHLTKTFGKREAVADVSFELYAGEVFGFLGPTGAGKTTTIRMLVGLARPDRGHIRIRGFDLARDFARAMAHVGS
ncbi:MAG: ATP-binding cassette domain-containing protein, partial [Thermoanaerobaculia bacterium]